MSDMTLRMLLLGEDRTASSSLNGLGSAAENTSKHLHGIGVMGVAAGAAIGGLAATGIASFARMGVSAVTAGVQTAASMEQANIAFTSLLGSGQKSQAFLAKLSTFAAATPFELPGLIDASRQLIGVGQSADSVIPTLTAFGDASGALGLSQDNFNHIMMATTQAMSAGTLHAGDLLQMTEAGLPVWKLMSESLGLPVAKLKDMSAKGQLLTKDVMPKLQAQMEKDYGGSMAKQSQTLTGLWSTLMDTFHQGMAKALIPMEPMLRSAIPGAANIMGKALSALGNGVGQFFGGLSGHVKRMDQSDRPKLELFGLGIRAMVQAFQSGDVTSKGFIGTMEKIGVAVRTVVGVLSGVFTQVMTWFKLNGRSIFEGLLTSVENLASVALPLVIEAWNAFKEPMKEVFQFIAATALPAITTFTGWLAKYGSIIRIVAVGVGAVVVAMKAWNLALAAWAIIQRVSIALQAAWNAVMDANPIGLIILAVIGLAAAFVYAYKHSETFRNIVHAAFHMVAGAIDFVKDHWKLLISLILGPFGVAIALVATNFGTIKRVAMDAIRFVVDIFLDMVGAMIHGAASAFGWVPGLGGKLKGAARAFDQFKNDVNRSLSGINDKTINVAVAISPADAAILRAGNANKSAAMRGYATGGLNIPDGVFTTGEDGFEVMRKSGSRLDILSNNQARSAFTSSRGGGTGDGVPVNIQFILGDRVIAQHLERVSHNGPPLRIRVAS